VISEVFFASLFTAPSSSSASWLQPKHAASLALLLIVRAGRLLAANSHLMPMTVEFVLVSGVVSSFRCVRARSDFVS